MTNAHYVVDNQAKDLHALSEITPAPGEEILSTDLFAFNHTEH